MNKKITIQDKVALVTGASRGIGLAITKALLQSGASKVYAGVRNLDSISDMASEYGDRLIPVKLDVTNDSDIANLGEIAGEIDILVNNAGILIPGNIESDNGFEALQSNLDVNLWGVVKVLKATLGPIKQKESGAIVTVSSIVGLVSYPNVLMYSISKAAVHSIIQGLRSELSGTGLLVTGVYPGPIDTDMAKGWDMEKATPEYVADKVIEGIENGEEYIFPDPVSSGRLSDSIEMLKGLDANN